MNKALLLTLGFVVVAQVAGASSMEDCYARSGYPHPQADCEHYALSLCDCVTAAIKKDGIDLMHKDFTTTRVHEWPAGQYESCLMINATECHDAHLADSFKTDDSK